MAKRHLEQYDKNGNRLDIYLNDDEVMTGGKTLGDRLTEMEDEIGEGGYQPPATGIPKGDLEQSVQDTLDSVANKVGKVAGKGLSTEDFTAALKAKLEALDPYTKTEVDAAIQEAVEGLGGAVSVTTNQDGTFTIHVGETDYNINLNHTHEGMAKLVKCTEATLPDELADDTIYVQVNDANNPTEIESLYLFGLEFTGGGVPAGTPAITRPSGTTINLGENVGSGVSKTVEIKANAYITGDLTVGLAANSDLSFDTTNLPSGVTYNSGAGTLTIAQATAIQGVNITVVYSGSGAAEIGGGLVISGGGATPKSVVVVVVVPQPIGVKLTGTQWLQTDYYPNANTEFELRCKFTDKGNTSLNNGYFLTCANNTDSSEKFQIAFGQDKYCLWWTVKNALTAVLNFTAAADQANFVLDNSILSWTKTSSNAGVFKFAPAGDESKAKSVSSIPMTYTMQSPLRIGRGNTYFFELFELTIYELTITENGTAVRHYVPKIVNGVPGLYDTVTDTFISSETSTEVEEVYANA